MTNIERENRIKELEDRIYTLESELYELRKDNLGFWECICAKGLKIVIHPIGFLSENEAIEKMNQMNGDKVIKLSSEDYEKLYDACRISKILDVMYCKEIFKPYKPSLENELNKLKKELGIDKYDEVSGDF